jgi:hypothetical protein
MNRTKWYCCVFPDSHGNYLDGLSGPNYSSQNLYVQPPTRSGHPTHQHNLVEDKSNLVPRGRSRGPLLDVSLSQLDRPATPVGLPHHHAHSHSCSRSGLDDASPSLGPPDPLGSPPRPPPPRPEGECPLSGHPLICMPLGTCLHGTYMVCPKSIQLYFSPP